MDLITLNEPAVIAVKDICFSTAEWAAIAAQVNSGTSTALYMGLIIGAIAGAGGLYIGTWYNKRRGK